MDSFKIQMLVLCAVSAVVFLVQLVRMVRRRDRGRTFDLLVSAAGLGVLCSGVFWPHATPSAPPPVRWLAAAVLILWAATLFGFGQWLFRPKAKPGQPAA